MKFLRFQRTFPRLLSKKGVPKNFTPTIPIYFGEVFEIPKDFLQKVLCVRVWGGQPQLITPHKKSTALPCFLFCQNMLELRSKPCFKRLLKKPLENPHTPFFRRKVCQRTLLKNIILFLRKLLKFQETFHEKFLVSGSRGGQPRFFYFSPGLSSSSFFRLPHEEQSLEHPEQPPRRLYLTVDITASTKRSATIPITI